jgi:hypothetical protein
MMRRNAAAWSPENMYKIGTYIARYGASWWFNIEVVGIADDFQNMSNMKFWSRARKERKVDPSANVCTQAKE